MARSRLEVVKESHRLTLGLSKRQYEQVQEIHNREGRQNFSDTLRDLLSKGCKAYWITESQVEAFRNQGTINQ